MGRIAQPVARIKDDRHALVQPAVSAEVCRELGLSWLNTPLSPPVTPSLLLQQVLADNCSNPEILRRTGQTCTAAAYCTAKGRLPVEVVEHVSRRRRPAGAPGTAEFRRRFVLDAPRPAGAVFAAPADQPQAARMPRTPRPQTPSQKPPPLHITPGSIAKMFDIKGLNEVLMPLGTLPHWAWRPLVSLTTMVSADQ